MPELPEVERARRLVDEHCTGHTITRVVGLEQGGGPRDGQFDDIVCGGGSTAQDIVKALTGRKLNSTHRKGKQMWFCLDNKGKHPLFHFGMTGSFAIKGVTGEEAKPGQLSKLVPAACHR